MKNVLGVLQAFFFQEARKFTDIYQLSLEELQLPLLIAVFWVSVEVLHVTENNYFSV
jgi:hypothetical protein